MNTSDSDIDLIPNVLTFQGPETTIIAKGPNINSTNISSLSFRNNIMTSTMNMPGNIDRRRYAESAYDPRERSMYHGRWGRGKVPGNIDGRGYAEPTYDQRERSMYHGRWGIGKVPCNIDGRGYAEPTYDQRERSMHHGRWERGNSSMSCYSATDMNLRNRHLSYYPGAMSSQRSMYGRSGSPVSVRTMDSNRSMSVKDIVLAMQNTVNNEFDLKIIKDACNQLSNYLNHTNPKPTRKRVEKRRKKMSVKAYHRQSRGNSGDQASNSSMSSSDDCRSTRTSRSTNFRGYISSSKTDISDFRRTIKESNMVQDRTEQFRQNSFKSVISSRATSNKKDHQNLPQKWQDSNTLPSSMVDAQKRFQTSLLLPSQRFNQSVASLPISDKLNKLQRINEGNMLDIHNSVPNQIRSGRENQDTDSDQEEIFADVTNVDIASSCNIGKRISENTLNIPNNRRTEHSPTRNKSKQIAPKQNRTNKVTKQKVNDFVFTKPQLPAKKPVIAKQKVATKSAQKFKEVPLVKDQQQLITETFTLKSVEKPVEKVIASSSNVVEISISKAFVPTVRNAENVALDKSPQNNVYKEQSFPTAIQDSHSDISMRPSFIKRKLFTQKVEAAEKNSSFDSLQADSPHTNVYSKIQKEKNRARKLVSTQSYLNRDIQDDSNLIDLIHKIVPAERLNATTNANRTELQNKTKTSNIEKLDVTSIITTCNNSDDVSDTFTDEDIFAENNSEVKAQKSIVTKKNCENEKRLKENKGEKATPAIKEKTTYESTKKPADNKNIRNQMITQSKSVTKDHIEETLPSKCMVVLEKLQTQIKKDTTKAAFNIPMSSNQQNDLVMSNICKGAKSFWDTDTESEFEDTLQKGLNTTFKGPTNTKVNAPLQKNINVMVPQVNKIVSKIKPKELMKKNATCQKVKLPSITKQKESTLNNTPNTPPKHQSTNQIETVNSKINEKTVKKSKVNKKSLPDSTKENNPPQKKSKKTIPESTKENNPPQKESNKTMNAKTKLKCVKDSEQQQEIVKKAAVDKEKPQKNDDYCYSSIKKNESQMCQQIKIHNNTLRIRAQRKKKVNLCCAEPDTALQDSNNSSIRQIRALRSRDVDLTTSLESDGNEKLTKKSASKNWRTAITKKNCNKNNREKTLQSDISFTLTTESFSRTTRSKKTSANLQDRKSTRSDISFTLSEYKTLNDTISTRSSRRNRELKLLQNNSASFFKCGKRSALFSNGY